MKDQTRATTKRVRLLKAIKQFQQNRGISPTNRDLVELCDISSVSVVSFHLDWLSEQGYLERLPVIARGIIGVTDEGDQFIEDFEGNGGNNK